jgi:hypothetical protein
MKGILGALGSAPAVLLVAAAALLAGCATNTSKQQVAELRRAVSDPKVVLMPLDVELSELTAGGLLEPKSEWTRKAYELLTEGLREEQRRIGFKLVEFSAIPAEGEAAERLDQLNRLHGVVGKSILVHRVEILKLPNKADQFDWTMGPEVSALRDKSGADYALFVYVRDSYASDGRKAAIVAAALFGVALPGGSQVGFASLVDLSDGRVVWFNPLRRGSGDLRTPEAAAETIKVLLTGFPK